MVTDQKTDPCIKPGGSWCWGQRELGDLPWIGPEPRRLLEIFIQVIVCAGADTRLLGGWRILHPNIFVRRVSYFIFWTFNANFLNHQMPSKNPGNL